MDIKDIDGIKRYVAVYGKDEDSIIQKKYILKDYSLAELRKIIGISYDEQDPGARDLIDCYLLSNSQLSQLKKYMDNVELSTDEFDIFLECSQDLGSDWNILSSKYGYMPPPYNLIGFTNAIAIKPKLEEKK